MRDDDIGDEGRPAQDAARRFDPPQLYVAVELLLAQADREDRNTRRLDREQRLGQTLHRVVGAVGHHDQAGERYVRELVVRPLERLSQVGARPVVRQLVHDVEAIGLVGEPEEPQREAFVQRGAERRISRRQLLLHELQARRLVGIGDPHTARVVDQHAEEVLLRDDRRENQHRLHQAERQDCQRREPDDGQDQPIDWLAVAPHLGIRPPGDDAGRHRGERREAAQPRRTESEVALLEHERAILEEELEDGVKHCAGLGVPASGSSHRR